MKRAWLCTLPFASLALAGGAGADSDGTLGDRYRSEVLPLVGRFCLDCHAADTKKGELDLERFETLADLRADTGVWQKVVAQIEDGEMPPQKKPQPTAAERGQLLGWIRDFLDAEARRNAGDPGPFTVRRLNNAEYTNTIRDLTGVPSLDPAREFPADGAAGEGFTNAAAALSTSPALVEKYLAAAKAVAAHAVLLPDGFRFEAGITRQDRTNSIIDQIRAIYLRHTGGGGVDFSYRAQVGNAAPESPAEGRVDIVPYFKAMRSGDPSGVNAKYLGVLRAALEDDLSGNVLLDRLRSMWQNRVAPEAMAVEVRAWQGVLWQFNTVGHLGLVRPWQGAVDPVRAGTVSVRAEVPVGQGKLFLMATGDGATRWRNPRFIKPGREPLPITELSGAAEAFARLRDSELPRTHEYLAVLAAARSAADPDVESLARENDLDPRLLRAWFALAGFELGSEIRDYLTKYHERPGTPDVGVWQIPGLGDLLLVANKGGSDFNIPGHLRAGKVAVHPRPERAIAVGWRSPVVGKVRVSGEVIDAHGACGNGVRWSLEARRGSMRRSLAGGEVDLGKGGAIPPVEGHEVREGDLLSLVIDARDGNHGCDLTQIELVIEGGGKRWSLCEDCAPSVGAGNPHADRYGNLSVWHFYSPPQEGTAAATAVPGDSALARWIAGTDDPAVADKAARELTAALVGEADDPMAAALRDPSGPLFGAINWGAAAGLANHAVELEPGGVYEAALPEGLVDGWEFAAEAEVVGTGGAQFVVPPQRPRRGAALAPGLPVVVAGDAAAAAWREYFDEFRALFPVAVSYTRIVPIDEVVTLLLFHREDEPIRRLMLSEEETARLNGLWDELIFVSGEPRRLVTAYEQLWQFATQDADPKKFEPFEEEIRERAAAYAKRLPDCEPAQLDALIAFAERAYRRPLEDADEKLLRDLYAELRGEGLAHEAAFRLTLARVLSSPHFLFKAEQPVAAGAGDGARSSAPVSGFELATRLSYFLWSSMPDAELRRAAAAGELSDPQLLEAQVRRMLHDPKSRRLAVEFACGWLGLRDFDRLDEKSEQRFPEFAGIRESMYGEVVEFFHDFFTNDRPVLSILDADHSFVDEQMASFYGLRWGDGQTGTMRIAGMRDLGRGGLLGMAAPLAKQSGASRTSPILRGNWVYEVLLGKHLPRPPKDVPQLPETPPAGLTERELIERHSSAPECAKCHEKIDAYGFALERFDAIGRSRDGVDTKAALPDGREIEGIAGLRDYMIDERRDEFVRQFCRKLLGYALGRAVMLSDEPLLADMMGALADKDYRVTAAVERVVASRQFMEIRTVRQ